jgi:death-on-curing protein
VDPVWVAKAIVLAIHDEQLSEHGGRRGVKDEGLLESALARPQNLLASGNPAPAIVAMAAAYGFGITRNHAFIDGNKRTSAVVTELFLTLNGHDLTCSDEEMVRIWLKLADSKSGFDEDDFGAWLRANALRLP